MNTSYALRSNLILAPLARFKSGWADKFLSAVSAFVSVMQRLVRNSSRIGDIGQGDKRPVEHRSWSDAAISYLILPLNPLAVFFAVVAIIVDSFNRKSRPWRLPHIKQKSSEARPAFTYLNASSAIVLKNFCIRVVASLVNSGPCCMHFGSSHSMVQARWMLRCVASAGLLPAVNYVVAKRNDFFAAFTSEKPSCLSISGRILDPANCGQFLESFSSDIKEFHKEIIQHMRGLVRRREAEFKQCIGGPT